MGIINLSKKALSSSWERINSLKVLGTLPGWEIVCPAGRDYNLV